MTEQSPKLSSPPTLASAEADWLRALFGFHTKTMTLLRESSLDDEKMKVVADRINNLLDDATAELKRTQQMNIKERLEAAYDEVKRLVDELLGLSDGGKNG
jgi:hypothetical protein